jgi:hypothetical protein
MDLGEVLPLAAWTVDDPDFVATRNPLINLKPNDVLVS